MKFSSKSRYGLNAMYHLALKNSTEYVSLTELAKITNISQSFLEKVMGILKKNRLIDANRGVQGGYRLVNRPESITVGQVVRALEGHVIFSDCTRSSNCNNFNCPNKGVYRVIYNKLNAVLDEITIQDMIDNKGEIL